MRIRLDLVLVSPSDSVSIGLVRRDERYNSDGAGIREQTGQLTHAPHALGPVGGREAQIAVQPCNEVRGVVMARVRDQGSDKVDRNRFSIGTKTIY